MLTFSSNIYLVSKDTFQGIVHAQHMSRSRDYAKESGNSTDYPLRVKPAGYTQNAWTCTILGLLNSPAPESAAGSLYHLAPQNASSDQLAELLNQDAIGLCTMTKGNKVHGLVTGGNAIELASFYLAGVLQKIIKNLPSFENLSIIWGQRSDTPFGKTLPQTSLLYHAESDSWCLQADKLDDKHSANYPKDVLTRDELAEAYQIVSIAPCDTLITPEDAQYETGIRRLLSGKR